MKQDNTETMVVSVVLVMVIVVATYFLNHTLNKPKCPAITHKYKFRDRVEIKEGFYQGALGKVIKAREWFIMDQCNEPSYEVKIYKSDQTIHAREIYLKRSHEVF